MTYALLRIPGGSQASYDAYWRHADESEIRPPVLYWLVSVPSPLVGERPLVTFGPVPKLDMSQAEVTAAITRIVADLHQRGRALLT